MGDSEVRVARVAASDSGRCKASLALNTKSGTHYGSVLMCHLAWNIKNRCRLFFPGRAPVFVSSGFGLKRECEAAAIQLFNT